MYNSKRKPIEEVPTALTEIWVCSDENCKGWMRDNFTFSESPTCPQCHSAMVKDERILDVIENNSPVTSKKL
ncbi:cold-shock protein [Paenibacillus camelliae]|uniref:cold-shock protein n=1 Tax=Paenibacillus camelliae TaxID=512410 RepID=UPI0020421F79|nr:cold-shock protein [Paenibacillus camelliae]MCM3635725.1 cold-shock protein [Paenibacillus camelliae]